MKTRNQIIYIPYPAQKDGINEYTVNMVKILQKKHKVVGELKEKLDVKDLLSTKAIFLNWIEDSLNYKIKSQLFLYHMFGAKIVWVFHNKLPHDMKKNNKIIQKMKWLSNKCDFIILHSKSSVKYIPNRKRNQKKAIYVPHILYDSNRANTSSNLSSIRRKYGIQETDFIFTIYGFIKPYKNIENGIDTFVKLGLPNAKLIIAGNPVNVKYARQIKELCINNKNIILDLHYLSKTQLDGLIGISDVIVLPYNNKSSMNSGVMIQAFSNGKTVISPNICMAQDFSKKGMLYIYSHHLDRVMEKAYKNGKEINWMMGKRAQIYIEQNHNEKVVSECLEFILN